MNKNGFIRYLKQRGKKPHVIDGLINQIELFEHFLLSNKDKGLGGVEQQDILDYSDDLEKKHAGAARKGMRGLSLYFQFCGEDTLAKISSGIREQMIAKNRKALPLREFVGVSSTHVMLLENIGVNDAGALLEMGATDAGRHELSIKTGIPISTILEMVKLSDLSRIEGVKSIRARLYHDVGVDTVEKLATQEPEVVLRLAEAFIIRSGFAGIPPLPKEVKNTIEAAKALPKIVRYD